MNHVEVFCVGNAVADVLARPVDHLAPPGTSQALDDVSLAPGGNSVNTAIALARLGVSVRVAAAIGEDRFGEFIRERLRVEGIDDAGLVVLPGAKTSTSIVLVENSGERRFLHLRGVSALFSGHHLDWSGVAGSRIFHYASAFAIPAFDETSLAPALRRARDLGCLTSLNICWDVRGRWIEVLRPAARMGGENRYRETGRGRLLRGITGRLVRFAGLCRAAGGHHRGRRLLRCRISCCPLPRTFTQGCRPPRQRRRSTGHPRSGRRLRRSDALATGRLPSPEHSIPDPIVLNPFQPFEFQIENRRSKTDNALRSRVSRL
jgi:pfkB family carbohydrate kinase